MRYFTGHFSLPEKDPASFLHLEYSPAGQKGLGLFLLVKVEFALDPPLVHMNVHVLKTLKSDLSLCKKPVCGECIAADPHSSARSTGC